MLYYVVHCLAPAAASITSLSHCISPSPSSPIQMRPPAASHRDTPHTASSTKQKLRNPGNSNESDSDASIQALEDPPNLVRGRKNAPIIIDGSDSEQDAARPAKRLRIENAHSPIPESILNHRLRDKRCRRIAMPLHTLRRTECPDLLQLLVHLNCLQLNGMHNPSLVRLRVV